MNGPKLIGRYEIVSEIGRGAMGSVFKARDPAVGRTVALKTVHATALAGDQSNEYRTRFYREARASGVLAHPGIVPVFDVGEHEGAPFLVMEFVEGRTLADAIKKGERFSLDRVCEIGQQIADALGYAHRQGVIHRDIKPANILMTSREVYGSERPRITDFGIAKLAASEITTTGQLLGTPQFMAPEQFTGTPVDGRVDIFSLGVILYSLATGEQPFAGETMTAVSYKIVYTEPIPPSKLNLAISSGLEAVVLKALAKKPSDRYRNCEELAEDLASIRAGASPAVLSSVPDAQVDADATLGPGQTAQQVHAAKPATQSSPGVPKLPGSSAPLAKPAEVAAGKKSGKPVQVETLFAVILLAVAGLGTAAAGAWFVVTHFFSFAHHHHTEISTSGSPTAPPTQPVVQIPQPGATTTTPDQTQPPTPPASASAAAAPASQNPPQNTPAAQNSKTSAPASNTQATTAKSGSNKSKQPSQQTAASAQQASTSNTTPANNSPAPTAPPASSSAAAPSSAAATPATGAVASTAFDPRKLDPNTSTKLKIDPSKMPKGLPVNVEMDKKPYMSFVTGDGTDLDNLYVPAGSHQLQIRIKSGGQEFASNTLNDSFKAKKKKTLKIEIQQNGSPLPDPAVPLPKDVQIVVSLPFVLSDVF